ncbi:MAG TPA: AfsR/SARP family transcriptional regulator [Pseudonocardiaceae bacterium]|nr:AfsR/SARP family transcriptional regulator [Pseudonocardiaceae bacterium]
MEFAILGPLEIHDQHRRIEVSSAKERLLLAMFVVHANEVISVDRLIEVLWGTEPPATAANTLQTYVSHLRRALEPDRAARAQDGLLRTRGQGYSLVVAPESVDAVRFERFAREGRDALPTDPERAAETLSRALALWRGEPLVEFRFELFAQGEITRLTELRSAVMEDCAEAGLALGRHATLCGELSRAVVEQPLRERRWSQLIRALYRCGRQADALGAYARLRQQLGEQLGIDPSPELVRLHEAVLAQSPDLDWRPLQTQVQLRPGLAALAKVPDPAQPLPDAHAALAAHDWQRAFEMLSAADREGRLTAEDLDGLAEAACWLGCYRESLAARHRAHQAFLRTGNQRRAALTASMLAMHHGGLRQFAISSGWFHRAQRLLEDEPDCAEHGYLSWVATLVAVGMGDLEAGLAAARSTYEVGVRHGAAELQAIGMAFQGSMLIHRGQVAEGLALLDEGMVMAVGGNLPTIAAVQIFCRTIRTCYELGDYRRADEWTEAIEDCFVRTGLTSFPGDCETHRIGILISRGAWALAEQEARRACVGTQCFDLAHVGLAFASIGEVRLRIGDLAGAEDAFTKAEELGASSLPGKARLLLRRGCPNGAAALINAALAGDRSDRLSRSRLLPDQVTIALAANDLDTARGAVVELTELAQIYGSTALRAAAKAARGALALATGEDDPLWPLQHSVELWQQAGSPYEGARARVLLATALERAGRPEPARVELAAAGVCFDSLGARLDAEAATTELLTTNGDRVRSP